LRWTRYTAFLERRAHAVLAVAALVTVASALLASRLELRTNVAELLPSRDPAVVELERLSRSLDGTAVLQIAIESPDRDANLRFAGALAARLQTLPRDTVSSVLYDVRQERQFFRDRQWLYVPLEDLESVRDSIRGEIDRRKSPLYVDLEDHEPPLKLVERLQKRSSKFDQFPRGFFESTDGKLVVIVCRPPGGLFAERAGEKLAGAARRLIADTQPTRFHPQMKVALTGDVISQLEERAALENDLVWATCVCVTLVCLVVVVFYGRFRALWFLGVPALIGVTVAFACAELAFGYLNASTAFLGSIVIGNGINFPIIQLARYDEERKAGRSVRDSVTNALAGTWRATGIAATGAALAYGSLGVTRFRGFAQFGAIGGAGMLAAWVATMTVLPALLITFDRRTSLRRFGLPQLGLTSRVAQLATSAPGQCLAFLGLITVLAAWPLKRYLHDPFEYDFRNLRNRRSFESGGASIAPRVDKLFGLTLTPSVVLADRREHADEIRHKVLDRDIASGHPLLGEVATLDDFLPGSLEVQKKKLTVLADLRALVDGPDFARLDEEDRERARELRPPDDLRPISDVDLPANVKRPFTELDGALGRIVLVYHGADVSVWDGHNLLRISDLIERIPLRDGTVVRSSGHAVVFAAMIRSIVHDAPLATFASLAGVSLLVLLLAGPRGAGPVLAVLCTGVLWMLGVGAWAGVRTNFLDFIALPITFGIGVDYGINIYLRSRAEGDPQRGVERAGGAVALCSLTTIIGYGALLVADNQALRSFGEMAILGEIACLSAALLGLPAWLRWRSAARRRRA
jgi:predicted RND superfamily exporter protein